MKILQIVTGYDISTNGGITNYVRNISETLVKNGHEVHVVYSQDNGKVKKYPFHLTLFKTTLEPFYKKSVIHNKDVEKIEKIIRKISPDIIHVHMMIDLPVGVLEMFKRNAKLVISLHDYSFLCRRIILFDKKTGNICENSDQNKNCNYCIEKQEATTNRYIRKIRSLYKEHILKNKNYPSAGHHERFVAGKEYFKQADALIAVSAKVKEVYEQNGYTNKKFIVNHIGNYTAEDTFRNQFFNKKPINKGEIIKFGFMGNLHIAKGIDIFLAFSKQCKHEFHVYGEIDNPLHEAEIKTRKNVFYHGTYNHEELFNVLKKIDIGLVLPIWNDSAPQVVFEFLNANIPIIGTKMGGLPDFINDENGMIFTPDEKSISEMINFINSEKIYDFYNQKVNNIKGTKKAIQHANELITIYKDL